MMVGTPNDYYEMEDSLEKKFVCSIGKQETQKVVDSKIPEIYYRTFRKRNVQMGQLK